MAITGVTVRIAEQGFHAPQHYSACGTKCKMKDSIQNLNFAACAKKYLCKELS
jgi:hypothetical protein